MGFSKSASWDLAMVCGVPLERYYLVRLRRRAQRCRAWFRLGVEDRRFLALVITAIDRVRSHLLARVLEPLLGRLMMAMGGFQGWMEALYGRVTYWIIIKGRGLALRLSSLAQAWGNRKALSWAENQDFIRYLAVMELYRPGIWS